ncbi:MAG: hypothetical protein AB8G99_25530 [Planctomycetaceae bacterium]
MDRLVAATCAWIAFGLPCTAQDVQPLDTAPRTTLLVLNSGRVVSGNITPRPDGYDVRKGIGSLFVAAATVRFEATDMADAYRKMRSTFKEFTPSVHISIARWCLNNSQLPAARQELLDALNLEPRNQTALKMLKRLEARAAPPAKVKHSYEQRMQQYTLADHESLGGLTEKQAAIFTSRVQPILERRCGNSSCHGKLAENEFVLKRNRGRSSPLIAERNLAAVLKHVNFKQPDTSPLVTAVTGPHVRDGRSVLPGHAGGVQKKIILDWVRSITEATEVSPAPQPGNVQTASLRSTQLPNQDIVPTAATRSLTKSEAKLVKDVRLSNENDPFDPAEFNRKHHGSNTPRKYQDR